ncbi:MAG: hypothetical protein MHPSP_001469, partial [Paramarteilia canceri]
SSLGAKIKIMNIIISYERGKMSIVSVLFDLDDYLGLIDQIEAIEVKDFIYILTNICKDKYFGDQIIKKINNSQPNLKRYTE